MIPNSLPPCSKRRDLHLWQFDRIERPNNPDKPITRYLSCMYCGLAIRSVEHPPQVTVTGMRAKK